jgi:antitoxin (DNA-binding transcriptional repressor) of toxin-antitoxin stability system
MAVVYISEADAIRDFGSVLAQVRAGTEVIIEDQDSTIALVKPAVLEAAEPEPGYDEWFRAKVERTLQNDPANRIREEDAEILMAEHRRAVLLKLHGSAA